MTYIITIRYILTSRFVVHNVLAYITIQYSTIVIIVYDSKSDRTIPQYNMSYIRVLPP